MPCLADYERPYILLALLQPAYHGTAEAQRGLADYAETGSINEGCTPYSSSSVNWQAPSSGLVAQG